MKLFGFTIHRGNCPVRIETHHLPAKFIDHDEIARKGDERYRKHEEARLKALDEAIKNEKIPGRGPWGE